MLLKNTKQVPPAAQKKFQEKYPQLQSDWKEIYSLPFRVTIETKIREFQYKLLNNIVFTNEKLFRLCTFCKRKEESIEHLMFHSNVTDSFWKTFCSWVRDCKVTLHSFTITDILFGVYNIGDDFSFSII